MFDPYHGLHIPYPILITSFHQFTLWILSLIFIKVRGIKRGSNQLKAEDGSFNWGFFWTFVVPTAAASAGDIGLSNVSLKFVPLTSYTIIKSSSVVFVLLFSCLFKLEKFHWKLPLITFGMFVGVIMMVYQPNSENPNRRRFDNDLVIFGSMLVLMSSCLSGFRWVYTQMILKNIPSKSSNPSKSHSGNIIDNSDITKIDNKSRTSKPRKPHPIITINQLSPIMSTLLFITSLIVEKPFPDFLDSVLFKVQSQSDFALTISGSYHYTTFSIFKGMFLLITPGVKVFVMTFCEFGILQISQVLTLSIAGVAKEVLTILFGMLVLHERIHGLQTWLGIVIILLVVIYYNYFRYTQEQIQAKVRAADEENTKNNQIVEKDISIPYYYNTDISIKDTPLKGNSRSHIR